MADFLMEAESTIYVRINLTFIKVSAVVFVLVCANLAKSDDADTSLKQYNHVLMRTAIDAEDDLTLLVREALFPPGWTAPTHFHNADLFIYVMSGQFEVTMEHTGTVIYGAGMALEMRSKMVMDARNVSDTAPLKLIVFQVGAPDSPFVVPVE
jgi:quercetin dioxygenase-like cupin family protein